MGRALVLLLMCAAAWGQNQSRESTTFETYNYAVRPEMLLQATCRARRAPTITEVKAWLQAYAEGDARHRNKRLHNIHLRHESVKLINALDALISREDEENASETIYPSAQRCHSAICAAEKIFGQRLGPKLLYMLARYGFNGSSLAYKDASQWQEKELDDVLQALEDFPPGLFPFTHFEQLTHFSRGHHDSYYRNFETADQCVFGNADINLYDCWSQQDQLMRQYVVFHELAHEIGDEFMLDDYHSWMAIGGWKGSEQADEWEAPNNSCFASDYARESPYEDFAESVGAYRYRGPWFKSKCRKKYNYLKRFVFHGIEYLDPNACPARWIASLPPPPPTSPFAAIPENEFNPQK